MGGDCIVDVLLFPQDTDKATNDEPEPVLGIVLEWGIEDIGIGREAGAILRNVPFIIMTFCAGIFWERATPAAAGAHDRACPLVRSGSAFSAAAISSSSSTSSPPSVAKKALQKAEVPSAIKKRKKKSSRSRGRIPR